MGATLLILFAGTLRRQTDIQCSLFTYTGKRGVLTRAHASSIRCCMFDIAHAFCLALHQKLCRQQLGMC